MHISPEDFGVPLDGSVIVTRGELARCILGHEQSLYPTVDRSTFVI
jgi:hypothetical protein